MMRWEFSIESWAMRIAASMFLRGNSLNCSILPAMIFSCDLSSGNNVPPMAYQALTRINKHRFGRGLVQNP